MSEILKVNELPSNKLASLIGLSEQEELSLLNLAEVARFMVSTIFYPKRISKTEEITGPGIYQFGESSDMVLPSGEKATWATVINIQTQSDSYRLILRFKMELFYQFNKGSIEQVQFR